jgi:hypothetical protein
MADATGEAKRPSLRLAYDPAMRAIVGREGLSNGDFSDRPGIAGVRNFTDRFPVLGRMTRQPGHPSNVGQNGGE